MIEVLRNLIATKPPHHQLNTLREFLQLLILQALDTGAFRKNLTFTGGTCLRVVFNINRFSEDLDFSLNSKKGFQLKDLSNHVTRNFSLLGLEVETSTLKEHKTVASFFFRFSKILYPLGLSEIKTEKLGIKFEIDMNPPHGGIVEEFLYQDPLVFMINHFDLSSLFSTKLHALLFRGYDKGRDYYDLFYFLRKKTIPSLKLFQAAAKQTHPELSFTNVDSIFAAVKRKLEDMDQQKIIRDVGPFLLDPAEQQFLRREILLKSLSQLNSLIR